MSKSIFRCPECGTANDYLIYSDFLPMCSGCYEKGTGQALQTLQSLPGGRTDAAKEPTLTGHRLDQKQEAELLDELEAVLCLVNEAEGCFLIGKKDRGLLMLSIGKERLEKIVAAGRGEAATATTDPQVSGPSNPEPPVASDQDQRSAGKERES